MWCDYVFFCNSVWYRRAWGSGGGGVEEVGLIDTGSSGIYGGGASCSPRMEQPTCCMGLERTNTHARMTKTTSPSKHTFFEDTIARIFLFSSFFSPWIYSMGPKFRGKRISTFVSYSRSYSIFSKVPRWRLHRRLWIPIVAYIGDFESHCSLQGGVCRIIYN
jgi:hypothetical protein